MCRKSMFVCVWLVALPTVCVCVCRMCVDQQTDRNRHIVETATGSAANICETVVSFRATVTAGRTMKMSVSRTAFAQATVVVMSTLDTDPKTRAGPETRSHDRARDTRHTRVDGRGVTDLRAGRWQTDTTTANRRKITANYRLDEPLGRHLVRWRRPALAARTAHARERPSTRQSMRHDGYNGYYYHNYYCFGRRRSLCGLAGDDVR